MLTGQDPHISKQLQIKGMWSITMVVYKYIYLEIWLIFIYSFSNLPNFKIWLLKCWILYDCLSKQVLILNPDSIPSSYLLGTEVTHIQSFWARPSWPNMYIWCIYGSIFCLTFTLVMWSSFRVMLSLCYVSSMNQRLIRFYWNTKMNLRLACS